MRWMLLTKTARLLPIAFDLATATRLARFRDLGADAFHISPLHRASFVETVMEDGSSDGN
jgi:hypothetical protein